MKHYNYRGHDIAEVMSGTFKGMFLAEYNGVCLACHEFEAAKKVVDYEIKRVS